jgi:hypothetical protein
VAAAAVAHAPLRRGGGGPAGEAEAGHHDGIPRPSEADRMNPHLPVALL